ncbi:hypothetical protein D5086_004365 [Populus alba]|uniref:Uncharacterized protein n=1 Tax=Populus alba TaxID=43335 RepID=A0ACC4CRE1_POPAL
MGLASSIKKNFFNQNKEKIEERDGRSLMENTPTQGLKRAPQIHQISGQVSFVPCPAARSGPFLSSSLLLMGRVHGHWAWPSSRLSFNTSTDQHHWNGTEFC